MYVDGKKDKNSVWTWIVANYKRNGSCPYVNQDRYPDLVAGNPNNIKKRTCEQIARFVGYEDDICRVLEVDALYELRFDQSTELPVKMRFLGYVDDFD